MDNLYEIEGFLEDLAEEIEPHLDLIPEFLTTLKETDKPLSIFSMTSFFPRIESIRLGIFEVAKIEEYYSLNILYRSLIEHFIKAQYIWMKTLENKDDEVGIDYWVFGRDQENIDYSKALSQSYGLIGVIPEKAPMDILKEMGVLSSEKSASLVRKKTDQFKYKNMVHYIADQINTKGTGIAPILSSIFPRYSELSSCVHGGPASVASHEYGPASVTEILEMATFSSLYTRWSSLILFYQYNKDVEPMCQITQKYLHQFTRHNKSSQQDASEAGASA